MTGDPLIGAKVGRYRLDARLGEGGMGAVYKAWDPQLKRTVAVKVMLPKYAKDHDYRKRFEDEAIIAGRIRHPNIVTVHDTGYHSKAKALYIVMQAIEGEDLSTVIEAQSSGLDERRALPLIDQIADALQQLHDNGLVHRDVKPKNVMIEHPGSGDERAYLTDFGIAREVHRSSTKTYSGTWAYSAPEVRRGQVGPAADQYSLGCVAYELLSGRPPYDHDIAAGTEAALSGRPPLLRRVATRDVTKHVADAIDRALATDPAGRHATVAAFAAATRIAAAEPDRSEPRRERGDESLDPTEQLLRRRNERRRRLLGRPPPRPREDDH